MNIYTVSLFGHRIISNTIAVDKALEQTVRELIETKEYVEFLVGRSGDFDILAASVIRRVQKELDRANSSLVVVLPYVTAEYRENEESFNNYYNETEICEKSVQAHYKAALQIRNQCMVDRSDLVVSCIEHNSGGAFNAVKYAEKIGVRVVNIIYTNL